MSFIALALLAAATIAPARAESHAGELQASMWAYGDTGAGWTGADGAYSVVLPDRRTVWLFSDTFLGPVDGNGGRPSNARLVNNSVLVQDGETWTTLVSPGPAALIRPPDGAGFYWVGDGIVQGDELLVFVMRFVSAPLPFAFQQVGTDVARFSLPSLTLTGIERMPFAFAPGVGAVPVSYGSALMTDGDWTYVYGVEDVHADKYVHVARAPAGHLLDGEWEYWGGESIGWTTVPAASVRVLSGVANELSVSRVGDRFVLVAQDHAIGKRVMASVARAPEGPWPRQKPLLETPESGGNIITYNAKAHEQLSSETTLVVSYNVNSLDFTDHFRDVTIYRPRFVEVAVPEDDGVA